MNQPQSHFLRGLLAILISRYFVRGLGILKGLLVAAILGPFEYGIYGLLMLFVSYSAYSDLGIFGGLNKVVPVELARKREEQARRTESMALGSVVLLILLAASVVWSLLRGRGPEIAAAVPALALAIVGQQLFKFTTVQLRARSRLRDSAFAFTLVQLLDVVLVAALVIPLRLTGVFLGQGIAFLIAALVVFWKSGLFPGLRLEVRGSIRLSASGLPLVVSTMTFLLLQTADRFLIAGMLGATSLGHYMIGVFCASLVYYIPQTVEYVLFPAYRQRIAALPAGELPPARFIEMPTRILSYVLPPFTAAIFLATPLITRVLPEYAPGIPSARILVMGTFFLSLVTSATSFLIASDRHWALLRVQGVAVALNVLLNVAALRLGYGIPGVALATGIGYLIYASAALFLAFRHLEFGSALIVRRLVVLSLPFLYSLATALLLTRVIAAPPGREITAVILRELGLLALLVPAVWFFQRTAGAGAEVLSLVRKAVRP